jgi:hypothetical protein
MHANPLPCKDAVFADHIFKNVNLVLQNAALETQKHLNSLGIKI